MVQYIYLSILIKTLKPDQGVLHSIGHVRLILTEIGRYLQNIDHVSKFLRLCCLFLSGKTCAELKRQMKRPDIAVHACSFRESLSQGLHASVESNYIDRVHTYARGACTKEVTCSKTKWKMLEISNRLQGEKRKRVPSSETRSMRLTD